MAGGYAEWIKNDVFEGKENVREMRVRVKSRARYTQWIARNLIVGKKRFYQTSCFFFQSTLLLTMPEFNNLQPQIIKFVFYQFRHRFKVVF